MFSMRLWSCRPFWRFYLGASCSVIGDWFNTVAIAVLAFQVSGRVSFVATTIAVSIVPRIVLGPLAGALADRFERRRMLIGLDAIRAPLALLPLLVHERQGIWLLYLTVLMMQAASCLYRPTQSAYLSRLVPSDLLEPANATWTGTRDACLFMGPMLAAAVLARWGTSAAFIINAASFLVVAGVGFTLPRAPVQSAARLAVGSLLSGYAAIARLYPRMSLLCLCYMAGTVPIFVFQGVVVAYARDLGQPLTFVGVLYGAAGLGGVLGSFVAGRYLRQLPYGVTIGLFTLSVPLLGVLALIHQGILACAVLACSSAANSLGDIAIIVGIQRQVPTGERGRSFALFFWCVSIGQFAGAIVAALLPSQAALQGLLWVSMGLFPLLLIGALLSMLSVQARPARAIGSIAEV